LIRCPLYTDENIVHIAAVEAAARLIVNELKVDKPELLKNIDIDKILPSLMNTTNVQSENEYSAVEVNKLVALIIGQNVEDIENLQNMSECSFSFIVDLVLLTNNNYFIYSLGSLEPQMKKTKR